MVGGGFSVQTEVMAAQESFPLGTEAKVVIRRRANATEHLNDGVRRQQWRNLKA